MKNIILLLCIFMSSFNMFAESKKELKQQIDNLTVQIDGLQKINKSLMAKNAGTDISCDVPMTVSQDVSTSNVPHANPIVILDSSVEDLSFVCTENEIRAYGYAESLDRNMARVKAFANATEALQLNISQYVKSGLKIFSTSGNIDNKHSINETSQHELVTACKDIIVGVSPLKTQCSYNTETGLYRYEICVKYEKEKIDNLVASKNTEIQNNMETFEDAMQEAWDALDSHNKPQAVPQENMQPVNTDNSQVIAAALL